MSVSHDEVGIFGKHSRGLHADAKFKQVTRDVKERGRDIEGCVKQWMSFVKPNFERYVEPQRKVAGKTNVQVQSKRELMGPCRHHSTPRYSKSSRHRYDCTARPTEIKREIEKAPR